MSRNLNRRVFVKTVVAGAAGACLPIAHARPASKDGFSFALFGDTHFDRLEYHDLERLQREKPNDVRQVQEYSRLRTEILPRLFSTVRAAIGDADRSGGTRVAFAAHVGDLVEGLCGNEKLTLQQDTEAVAFVRGAELGVPFLLTKGNHDITGPGAADAYQAAFQPFLEEQRAALGASGKLTAARYTAEQGDALFCFFDAYDKESLGWLEAALARRTARHCFVVVHPPVVPYGARATWYLFSGERERAQRDRMLALLGKHNAFVLSGHIHKYNLLVRATPGGGKFLQLGISSVIHSPAVNPEHVLSGVKSYRPDQVSVEPDFSPGTEQQRRAVYETEAPFVKQFEYADLPGYAMVSVNGPAVTARVYSGVTRQLWHTLELSQLLSA